MAAGAKTSEKRKVVLCSCEDTMVLAPATVSAGLGNDVQLVTVTNLCGSEQAKFRELAADGDLTVCCAQEARRFCEIAETSGLEAKLSFVNVRETAGWASEGRSAGPKIAALIAAGAIERPTPPGVTLESAGVTLILGSGQAAVDAAKQLEDRLDITVLLDNAQGVVPPSRTTFPIRLGRVRSAKGHLGAFELLVDGLAAPKPSSRAAFKFGPVKNGAVSNAHIIIDLTGGASLFPGHDLRDGYLRADPGDPAAVQRVLFKAADLVGTFDKPRYVDFKADLCAHSRSRITGCRRCLDVCPAGAISPAGDHVEIDPNVCGGCGHCAAQCPTGAANYAVLPADVLIRRLREATIAYAKAGGNGPTILLHDAEHGRELIEMSARYGAGLPADVIPIEVNEIGQIGLEVIASAFAYGAGSVRVLTRSRPRHDISALEQTIETARLILMAQGYGLGVTSLMAADDPDDLTNRLYEGSRFAPNTPPSTFVPLGGKRDILKLALRELHRVAPAPAGTVPLPPGSMFGRVKVQASGCTLCHSCVTACPTGALSDDKDKPTLKFDESLCVQCGLCQATCPEKVVSLEARIDFSSFDAGPKVLKSEEPYPCISCGKPFGVRSTIEKVASKLQGSHWMYTSGSQASGGGPGASRADLIRMCEDCRVSASMNEQLDPYGAPPRPMVRTTDDYYRDRESAAAREAEMLKRIKKGEA